MVFRPGLTGSGARQPGAARSHNIRHRPVSGQQPNDSDQPFAHYPRTSTGRSATPVCVPRATSNSGGPAHTGVALRPVLARG